MQPLVPEVCLETISWHNFDDGPADLQISGFLDFPPIKRLVIVRQ